MRPLADAHACAGVGDAADAGEASGEEDVDEFLGDLQVFGHVVQGGSVALEVSEPGRVDEESGCVLVGLRFGVGVVFAGVTVVGVAELVGDDGGCFVRGECNVEVDVRLFGVPLAEHAGLEVRGMHADPPCRRVLQQFLHPGAPISRRAVPGRPSVCPSWRRSAASRVAV